MKRSILFRSTALFLNGAVCAALMLSPQSSEASLRGARHNAGALFHRLRSLDLEVREYHVSGLLRRGQSTVVQTTLYAGNTYYLVAGGCEDAYDVDIAVFDGNGNLVARDNDTDQVAVAQVAPIYTGTFYVRITMYDSTPDGAHWVLQYGFH